VILALLTGAGVGLGLLMIVRGLAPPRAPLVQALARLEVDTTSPSGAWPSMLVLTPHAGGADGGGWGLALVGRPLSRLVDRLGLRPSWLRQDLAILGRSPERHMADKAILALFGLLLAPATAAGLAVIGISLPLPLPLGASLLLAVGGFFVPDGGVRTDAAARRRDLRHALGSYLDLTVIALAGGAGVEGALTDAASVGRGVAATGLRRALATARLRREPPWAALGRLGEELGLSELVELAASVELAGTEGAKVRASLAAKAMSLRAHQLAEAETQAQAATERMSLPVVLLFAGFLVFIGYPAMVRILGGL
jgi:tight adherence protein C